MNARILLSLGDRGHVETLSGLLQSDGFAVELMGPTTAPGAFDLIILDTMAECEGLRRAGIDMSILMVTEDPVTGLRTGADDCVSRSCDPNELLARVEALLRRVPGTRQSSITTLRFGDVEIDFATAETRKRGQPVSMASKELQLLQYLVEHRERIVSRKEILRHVWEYDSAVSSRTIDVHIGWLRQKLEDNPQQPRYIKTIRGRGYRFDPDEHTGNRDRTSQLLTLSNLHSSK